jgi:hypothetical protein
MLQQHDYALLPPLPFRDKPNFQVRAVVETYAGHELVLVERHSGSKGRR